METNDQFGAINQSTPGPRNQEWDVGRALHKAEHKQDDLKRQAKRSLVIPHDIEETAWHSVLSKFQERESKIIPILSEHQKSSIHEPFFYSYLSGKRQISEKLDSEIEVPETPEPKRDNIWDLLVNINRWDAEAQLEIINEGSNIFREKQGNEIDDDDILNIFVLREYADQRGNEEAAEALSEILQTYFEKDDIDIPRIMRSSSNEQTISPEKAKEIYLNRAEKIRSATNETYSDLDETRMEESIRLEQKQFLLLVLDRIEI